MKKEVINKKRITNRLLYTFIFLGIIITFTFLITAYGTSTPTTFGHSIGELNFSGGFTVSPGSIYADAFYYNSDLSLKKEIQQLQSPLAIIGQLEGVSFYWKVDDKKDIGLIAQDVEKVLPELVHTNGKGLKSVEYGNLVALLIEGMKEQQKEILELQNEVEELKIQMNK